MKNQAEIEALFECKKDAISYDGSIDPQIEYESGKAVALAWVFNKYEHRYVKALDEELGQQVEKLHEEGAVKLPEEDMDVSKSQEAMEKAREYHYRVYKSEEDDIYVAEPLEWDFLAAHGDTPGEALEEVQSVVAACIRAQEEEHLLPFPVSLPDLKKKKLV